MQPQKIKKKRFLRPKLKAENRRGVEQTSVLMLASQLP